MIGVGLENYVLGGFFKSQFSMQKTEAISLKIEDCFEKYQWFNF